MIPDDIRDNDERIKPIDKLTDEEVEKEFEQVIREKMSNNEFWEWVRSWKRAELLIEEVIDGWTLGDKEETIKDFRKGKFLRSEASEYETYERREPVFSPHDRD